MCSQLKGGAKLVGPFDGVELELTMQPGGFFKAELAAWRRSTLLFAQHRSVNFRLWEDRSRNSWGAPLPELVDTRDPSREERRSGAVLAARLIVHMANTLT